MKKHLLFFAILIAYGCTESDLTFNPVVANSDGAPEFVQTFGGSKNDVAKSVVATTDGGFAVLGYTQSMDGDVTGKTTENYDFWVKCYFCEKSQFLDYLDFSWLELVWYHLQVQFLSLYKRPPGYTQVGWKNLDCALGILYIN